MKKTTRKASLVPYQKRIEKPWGYEVIYTNDQDPITGKFLHVKAGKRLSLQYHDGKVEALCLIKGKAFITLSDANKKIHELPMEVLKGYFIAKGQIHRITAKTNCDIIESSTPEKGNTFRIEDDAGRKTETETMRKKKNRGWECQK